MRRIKIKILSFLSLITVIISCKTKPYDSIHSDYNHAISCSSHSDVECYQGKKLPAEDMDLHVVQKNKLSSTISIISSSGINSVLSCRRDRTTIPKFSNLSAEEKTENLLECLGYRCDAIYYPGTMNHNKGMSGHTKLSIKHAFEAIKAQIDEVERMSCLGGNKLVINLLLIDKHQRSKLLKLSNKAEGNYSHELQYISNLLDTKGELLLEQEKALKEAIKKKTLSLNTARLLGSENLTKKIRKCIDDYNQVVSEEDKFSREDVDKFFDKIVQNTTYESIKSYLSRWTFRSEISEKFYLSHNKVRFLDKLKVFILSINPKLNAQSELLIKLTTELQIVQKKLAKHNYFFETGGVTFSLLAFGAIECHCLQDMDVSTVLTDEIKEDEGHDKEAIDKVYMLVYASDDICNACTNAIPKVQSLISEKLQQQGVTVNPSAVDVLYLPISDSKEVDLDKLIMKKIK